MPVFIQRVHTPPELFSTFLLFFVDYFCSMILFDNNYSIFLLLFLAVFAHFLYYFTKMYFVLVHNLLCGYPPKLRQNKRETFLFSALFPFLAQPQRFIFNSIRQDKNKKQPTETVSCSFCVLSSLKIKGLRSI